MVNAKSGVSGGGGNAFDPSILSEYATQDWVDENYLSLDFFNAIFKAKTSNGVDVLPNQGDLTTIDNIQAMFGFWTEQYISALGQGDDGGGDVTTLAQLDDVDLSLPLNDGEVLTYNSTLGKWTNGTGVSTAWANITGKPTTIAGYGITDAHITNGTITLGSASITPITSLTGYATKKWVTGVLANYVTTSGLTTTLADYVTTSALNTTLASYVTTSALSTTLADYVTNTSLTTTLAAYGTKSWVESNYISKAFFNRLFRAFAPVAEGESEAAQVEPNDVTTEIDNIKAMFGLWTEQYLSALGLGSDAGHTIGVLNDLNDVTITNPQTNQVLTYNGTQWVNDTAPSGASALSGLTDVAISSLADKDLLQWDYASGKWKNVVLSTVMSGYATTSQLANYLPLSGGTINANNGKVPLILKGGLNGFREGLRVIPYNNWSDIVLCGSDAAEDNGTSANTWFIGNNNGKLYITRNGSDSGDAILSCVNNEWSINGNSIIHSGNISSQSVSYATSAGSVAWGNISSKPSEYTPSSGSTYYVGQAKVAKSVVDSPNNQSFLYNVQSEQFISGYGSYWYVLNMGSYTGGNYRTQLSMPYDGELDDAELFIRKWSGNNVWTEWRRVCHSGNSSVSKSGETLTVKIDGTSYSLTNTDHTYNFYGVNFRSGDKYNEEEDCNSATDNGHYYYTSNGPSGLGESTDDGALYVQRYNENWVGQIAQDYRNGRIWVRGKNNGSWQSWKRIAQTGEAQPASDVYSWAKASTKPSYTASEVGALPISGGTLNGNLGVNGQINLNRVNDLSYGRISFYSSNYYTWFFYMSPSTSSRPDNSACPTGGSVPSGTYVTNWGLRSLIENASGYGWTWESCTDSSGANPSIKISNTGDLKLYGNFYATGGVTAASDIRLKDIIADTELSVKQIANAPAKRFYWKRDHSLGEQVGSIAQYWQQVLPQSVSDNGDELGLQYGVAALISSITIARKVVNHEERIEALERENADLKQAYSFIKNAYEQLRLKIA